MSAKPHSLRLPAAVLTAVLGASGAVAQNTSSSPFMPAQSATAPGAPTPGAPLEFRGSMEERGVGLYRIVDPTRKAGAWVKLNEREPSLDFVVKQHDGNGDNETVVVEQSGRSFTLPLRSSKVVSSGAAGQGLIPPPPSPIAPNMPAAVVNSVVVNPTPADEQRRLEAVAAEVARRRALREQATQQVNQGQPVMPQALPQQPQQTNQRPGTFNQPGRAGQPPGRQQR